MSTQITFDLAGLSRAIERGDARYLLALYAENAEIQLVDVDQPDCSRFLQGKAAIGPWIEEMCSRDFTPRVVNSRLGGSRVALTEEYQTADGRSVRHAYSAEVFRGQITRQTVICSIRTDVSAPAEPMRSREPAMSGRNLAGNFLG